MNISKTSNTIVVKMISPEEEKVGRRHSEEKDVGKKGDDKNKKVNSVFAGELNIIDPIASKEVEAKKNSIKALLDQFKNELEIDKSVTDREKHIKDLEKESEEAKNQLSGIELLKQQTKELYGVEDGSQEQQDLDLLLKQKHSPSSLTNEEKELLSVMVPTDYQREMLEYDKMSTDWTKEYNNIQRAIDGERKAIKGTELARLKTHPMVDASKESEKIIKEAIKETIGMVQDETKGHIDDEIEKDKEEAEKTEEKEAEKEVKVIVTQEDIIAQENKENIKELSKIQDSGLEQSKLQSEIKNLMQKIPMEDIKGLAVDKKI